jgi:hypothetical protein
MLERCNAWKTFLATFPTSSTQSIPRRLSFWSSQATSFPSRSEPSFSSEIPTSFGIAPNLGFLDPLPISTAQEEGFLGYPSSCWNDTFLGSGAISGLFSISSTHPIAVGGALVSSGFVNSLLVHTSHSKREREILGLAKTFMDKAVGKSSTRYSGSPKCPPSQSRKKNKCIKSTGQPDKLVLVADITMPQVLDMANLSIVGGARGRRFILKTLKAWVEAQWSKSLGYFPSTQVLARG